VLSENSNYRPTVETYICLVEHLNEYYVALGSNLGDKAEHLRWAVAYLEQRGAVTAKSARFANSPEGFHSDNSFENAVVHWRTELDPEAALAYVLQGESLRGRPQRADGEVWSDRPIDMDLLMWSGGGWKSDRLTLPHPRMQSRAFVMVPLMRIHPQGEKFVVPEGAEKLTEVGTL